MGGSIQRSSECILAAYRESVTWERAQQLEGSYSVTWDNKDSLRLEASLEDRLHRRRSSPSPLAAQKVSRMQDLVAQCSAECTKIARFSAVAAAIFTAPGKIARLFEAPRCAISSAKKIASEPRCFLRWKRVKMILTAECPAILSSAVKIASEQRCAILVHSGVARHPQV